MPEKEDGHASTVASASGRSVCGWSLRSPRRAGDEIVPTDGRAPLATNQRQQNGKRDSLISCRQR